jgi:hypothetical protein
MQLMLEKMENMTKVLEQRDTLLEKAEVRAKEAEKQLSQVAHSSELAPAVSPVHFNNHFDIAPTTPLLLSNSPPLPYNNAADDDIYMGDSESDKQKERVNRKAMKKSNAPRSEKKRKNAQREKHSDDSDVIIKSVEDRMVKQGVDFDDDSDNEYKQKRKAMKKGKAPQREEDGDDSDVTIKSVKDLDGMIKQGVDFDDDSENESNKRKDVKVPQREENSDGNLTMDSDEDRMPKRVIFDEDYEVVDADMASLLN